MADLIPAVTSGPVILVNAAQRRGDAVILDQHGAIHHLPLPDLARHELATHVSAIVKVTQEKPDPKKSFSRTLRASRVSTAMLG